MWDWGRWIRGIVPAHKVGQQNTWSGTNCPCLLAFSLQRAVDFLRSSRSLADWECQRVVNFSASSHCEMYWQLLAVNDLSENFLHALEFQPPDPHILFTFLSSTVIPIKLLTGNSRRWQHNLKVFLRISYASGQEAQVSLVWCLGRDYPMEIIFQLPHFLWIF